MNIDTQSAERMAAQLAEIREQVRLMRLDHDRHQTEYADDTGRRAIADAVTLRLHLRALEEFLGEVAS